MQDPLKVPRMLLKRGLTQDSLMQLITSLKKVCPEFLEILYNRHLNTFCVYMHVYMPLCACMCMYVHVSTCGCTRRSIYIYSDYNCPLKIFTYDVPLSLHLCQQWVSIVNQTSWSHTSNVSTIWIRVPFLTWYWDLTLERT